MQKIRCITAGVLSALLLFYCTLGVDASEARSSWDAYANSIESSLQELDEQDFGSTSGQYALFEELGRIVRYAVYLDVAAQNRAELNMPSALFNAYAKRYYQHCKEFNASFAADSTLYTPLTLGVADAKYKQDDVVAYVKNNLASVFKNYVNDYLTEIQQQNLSESELSDKYGAALGTLYSVLETLETDAIRVRGWGDSGVKSTLAPLIDDIMNAILNNSDYETLVNIGSNFKNINRQADLYVDTTATYIENLADVAFSPEGELEAKVNPRLSMNYLAFLAASSVYEPLTSYTGSSEFLDTLNALFDDDQRKDAKLLYNTTRLYKKPLYKRNLDSNGNPTGVATMITVQQFFDDIENGNVGALCTILGYMGKSEDAWLYLQSSESVKEQQPAVQEAFTGSVAGTMLEESVENLEGSDEGSGEGREAGIGSALDTLAESVKSLFAPEAYAAIDDGFSERSENPELGTSGGITLFSHVLITDESAMSQPVLLYGAKYAREVDNMTTAIMTNILKSSHNVNSIENKESSYLYVNAYGDIVLKDDLVVLPGAANPLVYNNAKYNPFTAAFMNTYPSVLRNTSYFKLASKADIGKYMVFGQYNGETRTITDWLMAKTSSINTIAPEAPLSAYPVGTSFSANNGIDKVKVFKTRRLIFGADDDWGEGSKFYSYTPLLNSATITVNGSSVFPYSSVEDEGSVVGTAIVSNMFTYYGISEATGELQNQGNLNDGYILDAFIINCLNGTDNAAGFEADMLLEYENYTGNAVNRKLETLKSVSNMIFENTTSVSGVVGIKSVYDNAVVGKFLGILRENWVIFFFLVIIMLLIFFSKARLDAFQCIVFSVVILVSSYLFVSVFPSLLPGALNFVTNNLAQNLTYEILSLNAERYCAGGISDNLNDAGELDYKSTSVTLYKVQGNDRTDFINSLNVDPSALVGGNIVMINKEAGVFAKDDTIRVNLNVLFDTLKINGKLDSSYAYRLSTKKTVSNNVDYYTPYYQIVDSLVEKINVISEIYTIPRRTTTYPDGSVKNNYLVYCYVNSKPFVTPGEYSYVVPTSELDWLEEEVAAYQAEGQAVSEQLEEAYGNNVDWLGISNFLYDLSKTQKKTLWAQTMRELGYYDSKWRPNEEKMDDLVTYVNYQTKKFVYDMTAQVGYVSDDTMIKVISMRALIAMMQRVSDLGHWMYPYTINYDEMLLKDVMHSVFVSDYDAYVAFDMDVVQYVLDEYGWFNLIVFDVLTILLFITASLFNMIVPFMYLAIGILLLFKLVTAQGVKNAIKGYLKASVILFVCSTMITVSILVARAMNGSVISIYFLLAATAVILYVIVFALLSVIRNFADFGNVAMNVRVENRLKSVSGHVSRRQRAIHTDRFTYRRGHKGRTPRSNYRNNRYRMDARMDDVYSSRYRYGGGYGSSYGGSYGMREDLGDGQQVTAEERIIEDLSTYGEEIQEQDEL